MIFILIDDDPIANLIHRKIIETTCQELSAEIVPFLSAAEALDFITGCHDCGRDKKFIILLDINMPGIDGWEFLDRLGSNAHPWKNVYILSSSVAHFDKSRAQNYSSVKGYITKPLSVPSVKSIVEAHLIS